MNVQRAAQLILQLTELSDEVRNIDVDAAGHVVDGVGRLEMALLHHLADDDIQFVRGSGSSTTMPEPKGRDLSIRNAPDPVIRSDELDIEPVAPYLIEAHFSIPEGSEPGELAKMANDADMLARKIREEIPKGWEPADG